LVSIVLFLVSSVSAQTLTLQPAPVTEGYVSVGVVFTGTPRGVPPLIVQWDFLYSPDELRLAPGSPSLEPAAKNAGKTLTCRGTWKKAPAVYAQRCMIAGGAKPISDGILAVLRFQVRPKNPPTKIVVQLDNIEALVNMKRIRLRKAEAVILANAP